MAVNKLSRAAVLFAGLSVGLLFAAVAMSPRGSDSLLQAITIGGQQYYMVPIQETRGRSNTAPQQQWTADGQIPASMRRRMGGVPQGRGNTGLFGPGDLPMPIEDDGDYYNVIPGSNVFFYEHGVPPIPHGMDDNPDPPYSFGFPSYSDPNY